MPKQWNIETISNTPDLKEKPAGLVIKENNDEVAKLKDASGYAEKRLFAESFEEAAKAWEPVIHNANVGETAFHRNRKEASKNMKAEAEKFRFEHANKNPKEPNYFGKTDSYVAKVMKDKTIADARAGDPSLDWEGSIEAYKRGRANEHERGEIDDSKRVEISSEFHGFEWGQINWQEAYKNPQMLKLAIDDRRNFQEDIRVNQPAEEIKKPTIEPNPTPQTPDTKPRTIDKSDRLADTGNSVNT